MTKDKITQLNDYIKDKSKIRLDILCGGLKVNKKQLELLISDYEKDSSKQRLKLIDNFINSVSIPAKTAKIKESKLVIKSNPLDLEIIRLNRELGEIQRNSPKYKDLEEFKIKLKELEELESKAGYNRIDPKAQEKTEICLIKGILGDWNIEGTYAWEILNTVKPRIVVQNMPGDRMNSTAFDMNVILGWLAKHSNKPLRKFKVQSTAGLGNSTPQKWILTDESSGLGDINMMVLTTSSGATVDMKAVKPPVMALDREQ